MDVEYIEGDVIDSKEIMIVHGCNAQGVMGRGVALAIKKRLPFAFEAYRRAFLSDQIVRQELYLKPRQLSQLLHSDLVGSSAAHGWHGSLNLGEVVWAINVTADTRPRIVGNAITQKHWHPRMAVNGHNVDYEAVRSCLQEVNRFAILTQRKDYDIAQIGIITRVAFPRIGAGLGGGDWTTIAQIIKDESHDFTPVVYLKNG